MRRSLYLLAVFFLFISSAGIYADDPPSVEVPHALRNRAYVMDINTQVLEKNQAVVWNESRQRVTISGTPVSLRLVGTNVAIALQFTPFIRNQGESVLVAQVQVWLEVPNEGINYHTSIQTIPLKLDEPIYFLPLGPPRPQDSASIEVVLTMKPYEAETPTSARRGNGR